MGAWRYYPDAWTGVGGQGVEGVEAVGNGEGGPTPVALDEERAIPLELKERERGLPPAFRGSPPSIQRILTWNSSAVYSPLRFTRAVE